MTCTHKGGQRVREFFCTLIKSGRIKGDLNWLDKAVAVKGCLFLSLSRAKRLFLEGFSLFLWKNYRP
jgi:hypothetical protein